MEGYHKICLLIACFAINWYLTSIRILLIDNLNAVKCSFTELTTKSACVSVVVKVVNTSAHVLEFHMLVYCSMAYVQIPFLLESVPLGKSMLQVHHVFSSFFFLS